jgi:hypothetical protein
MDAPPLKFASENEKPGQLEAKPGFLALAVFIKRPQAEKIKSAQHQNYSGSWIMSTRAASFWTA